MRNIKIEPYGEGQKLTIINSDGQVGAIIYIDKNGYVDQDSWIARLPKHFPKPKKIKNPSSR